MSRSHKKNPVMKSTNCKKFAKRQASKKVRKSDEVSNGGEYKKIGEGWDINDYVGRCFRESDKWWFREANKEYLITMK
ncbi:MAG: hypothetical protein DRJ01_05875 [Bacteroidetes bacterium]|nr:MAG: hypothetical protein DRJ01_05875 [Bacteroidota bacterium]